MKIAVLALDGVFDTGLTAVLDAFTTANDLGRTLLPQFLPFDVSIVGKRRKVLTAQGLLIPVRPVSDSEYFDWVIVPALSAKTPEHLVSALSRRDVSDALMQLRKWNAAGTHIAAACVGTFLLAEAGLLDGQTATTTWWLSPFFRQRYPKVCLDESRMLVPSGSYLTAGAAMGHLDLSLWLMNQISPEVAALVARYMIVDERPSQAPYMIPDHLARADPLVERFEHWARERLSEGFSLQAASEALSTSKRTLQRRMEAVLGKSPLSYFQDLRVERAQHLVRTSTLDIEAIATQVGYADGATLRSLLRRRLGRGVRELRVS